MKNKRSDSSSTAIHFRLLRQALDGNLGKYLLGAVASILIALFVSARSGKIPSNPEPLLELPEQNSAQTSDSADRSPASLSMGQPIRHSEGSPTFQQRKPYTKNNSYSSADDNRGSLHNISDGNSPEASSQNFSGNNLAYAAGYSALAHPQSAAAGSSGDSGTSQDGDSNLAPGGVGGFSGSQTGSGSTSNGGLGTSSSDQQTVSDVTGSESSSGGSSSPPLALMAGVTSMSGGNLASSASMMAQISIGTASAASMQSGTTVMLESMGGLSPQ